MEPSPLCTSNLGLLYFSYFTAAAIASPESSLIDHFASEANCEYTDVLTDTGIIEQGFLRSNVPTYILQDHHGVEKGLYSKCVAIVLDVGKGLKLTEASNLIGSVETNLLIMRGENSSQVDTANILHKFVFIERNKRVRVFCPQVNGAGRWTGVLHIWSHERGTFLPTVTTDPRDACPSQLRGADINVAFSNRPASKPRLKEGSQDPYGIDVELMKILEECFGFTANFTLTFHFNEGFSPLDKMVEMCTRRSRYLL